MIDFFNNLAPWGNVCSILGLLLSILLMFQAGRIKKSVDEALAKNNRLNNYINMRDGILKGLMDCAGYLIDEHSPNERLPYLQKLDGHLADLAACYPNMTDNMKRDINDVRSSCNGINFSYIKIIKPLNNIISMLKLEAIAL